MSIVDRFETYDEYLNEMLENGDHIDECLTEEEFNDEKNKDKEGIKNDV